MHAADVGRLAANLNALDPLPARRHDHDLHAGRMQVALQALEHAVEAAEAAAFWAERAAAQGAGDGADLACLERIEPRVNTLVARHATALDAVRRSRAGKWP